MLSNGSGKRIESGRIPFLQSAQNMRRLGAETENNRILSVGERIRRFAENFHYCPQTLSLRVSPGRNGKSV